MYYLTPLNFFFFAFRETIEGLKIYKKEIHLPVLSGLLEFMIVEKIVLLLDVEEVGLDFLGLGGGW